MDSCSVVGVAFSGIEAAEGHGFIIPVPVVKYFLDGFKARNNPLFGLLPELGIATDELVNPMMRKSCFGGTLPKHRNGCLITGVAKHSCAEGQLKTGDILMAVDGAEVSEKADIEYRGQERLSWKYLVSTKQPGEAVEVTVLRAPGDAKPEPTLEKAEGGGGVAIQLQNGGVPEELKMSIELAAVPRLLPRVHELDYHSTYCIYGGLVVIPVRCAIPFSLHHRGHHATRLPCCFDCEFVLRVCRPGCRCSVSQSGRGDTKYTTPLEPSLRPLSSQT